MKKRTLFASSQTAKPAARIICPVRTAQNLFFRFSARRKKENLRPCTEKNEPQKGGSLQSFAPLARIQQKTIVFLPEEPLRSFPCLLSGGQLCAALCAAASQHLTAVCRAHALAEAVLHGALTLLGLIRSLHSSCTSLFFQNYGWAPA
jgi:hypothetical protein